MENIVYLVLFLMERKELLRKEKKRILGKGYVRRLLAYLE